MNDKMNVKKQTTDKIVSVKYDIRIGKDFTIKFVFSKVLFRDLSCNVSFMKNMYVYFYLKALRDQIKIVEKFTYVFTFITP